MELMMALMVGAMFGIAVFQLLRRNLVRSAIGFILLSNAVNLFLLAAGAYQGTSPAYAGAEPPRSDALPQALILTAIVISMGGFAFVLSLLRVIAERYHTMDSDDLRNLRH
jgi:multicomponent Na+:H+ antiporter subunit C